MEILKIDLNNINQDIIEKITEIIRSGGVVVVPTDTIYGLICDATQKEAIEKIFEIKKRDFKKPIGIFVGDIGMARQYVKIEVAQEELLKSAHTFVFFSKKRLPYQGGTLGIRLPKSKLILKLIKKLNFPLTQTSANLSGTETGNDIEKIIRTFEKQNFKPDLILDAGKLKDKKASKVIDLTGKEPKILRN